jgi:HEPN superfamily Swt1-like protein
VDGGLSSVKRLVFDGILASKDLEELARTLPTQTGPLVSSETSEEATDPSWYPAPLVAAANRVSRAYYRLYLFENQVRRLIESVLLEAKGAAWWEDCVPEPVRNEAVRKRDEEGGARFHHPRGDKLIDFASLRELGKIIEQNWGDFEDILYRKEWVLGKLEELRLTRNAIAHMSDVAEDDLSRLDMILKDWNRQVG